MRKASQRDWLALTHHETSREEEGSENTNSRTEQTKKEWCVNEVSSQAEKQGQRPVYLANASASTVRNDRGHISPSPIASQLFKNSSMVCLCF